MTTKKPTLELTKRFIKGLQNYNLTYEEIKNGKWKYSGGNAKGHLNYFRTCYGDKKLPDHKFKCICGHAIKENCYITDGKEIITLGNCCIKKFLPEGKSGRTCEDCGKPHRNRKDNKCHDCRDIKYNTPIENNCRTCGIKCNSKYKYCYNCHLKYKLKLLSFKNSTNN